MIDQAQTDSSPNGKKPSKARIATSRPKSGVRSAASNKIPWTFPKETLEVAIQIPKAIDELHGGNPMAAAI